MWINVVHLTEYSWAWECLEKAYQFNELQKAVYLYIVFLGLNRLNRMLCQQRGGKNMAWKTPHSIKHTNRKSIENKIYKCQMLKKIILVNNNNKSIIVNLKQCCQYIKNMLLNEKKKSMNIYRKRLLAQRGCASKRILAQRLQYFLWLHCVHPFSSFCAYNMLLAPSSQKTPLSCTKFGICGCVGKQ